MSALRRFQWTEADYLKLDRTSDVKYEYLFGEVYAMAGASAWHTLISGNLAGILFNGLYDSPCSHHPSDLRVKIPDANYVYPDMVVICGDWQLEVIDGVDTLFNPTVVFEILSASTQQYDETGKAIQYRRIPSLQEYIVIAQHQMKVWQYRRDDNWKPHTWTQPDDSLRLASIGCDIPLATLYRRVVFKG